MFFVDLPNQTEREAIWTIQIRKRGRNPADFDPAQLARASDGLTGSEIAAMFIESIYDAFDRETEPTDLDIARALTDFVPLSRTMAEQINALRTWAAGRARFATSSAATEHRSRKFAA
jgi:SpoVK/Ycf46/Vps4 family AAA+-type ATPase